VLGEDIFIIKRDNFVMRRSLRKHAKILEIYLTQSKYFLAVCHKSEELGQGNQIANTDRTGYVPVEAGGCTSWYGAVETGRSLPVDVTYLPTLARRQGFRDTRMKYVLTYLL
jgi:hypothetical protein